MWDHNPLSVFLTWTDWSNWWWSGEWDPWSPLTSHSHGAPIVTWVREGAIVPHPGSWELVRLLINVIMNFPTQFWKMFYECIMSALHFTLFTIKFTSQDTDTCLPRADPCPCFPVLYFSSFMITVSQHSQSNMYYMKGKIIKRVSGWMYECHKWANTRLNPAFTGHGIRERETILDLGVTSYIIIAWHKSALAPSIPLSIRFHLALRPWASIASRNGSYQECSVVAMLSSLVIIVQGHRNWNMKITRRCSLGSDCMSLNLMLLKIAWGLL